MLLGNPMPFDAVASRDTELVALSRRRWTELLASSPSLSMRWMTSIARRLDDDRRRLVVVTSKPLVSQVAYLLAYGSTVLLQQDGLRDVMGREPLP